MAPTSSNSSGGNGLWFPRFSGRSGILLIVLVIVGNILFAGLSLEKKVGSRTKNVRDLQETRPSTLVSVLDFLVPFFQPNNYALQVGLDSA